MTPSDAVWIFHADGGRFAGGVFSSEHKARDWIKRHRLTGVSTAYPIDEGVLQWAERTGMINMKPEKLEAKKLDPSFVGSFTSASQTHYHSRNGEE